MADAEAANSCGVSDQIEGEERLWLAVLKQAWSDCFEGVCRCRPHDREEAHRFLFDTSGQWARYRKEICRRAGVDASDLRDKALEHIKQRQVNDVKELRLHG